MLRRSIIIITNNPSHLGVITERSVALVGHSRPGNEYSRQRTGERERERETMRISPHVDNVTACSI